MVAYSKTSVVDLDAVCSLGLIRTCNQIAASDVEFLGALNNVDLRHRMDIFILFLDTCLFLSLYVRLMSLLQLISKRVSVHLKPCLFHIFDFLFLHDLLKDVYASLLVFF